MTTHFLISRTDSIGDVLLTLPICHWLKEKFPTCKITFLGNTYTQPILACYPEIDQILEWKKIEAISEKEQIQLFKSLQIDVCIHVFPKKEIAHLTKKAGIKTRIGTSHRLFHFFTCNVRPNFTRKGSDLHEAQLNFELLKPLGLEKIPSLEEITKYIQTFQAPKVSLPIAVDSENKKIILHPKSQGSALEWPIEKYTELALMLAEEGHHIYFTGTEKEGDLFRTKIPVHENIKNITGKFTLTEFIAFIQKCDAIVACSTGPLHIGAILGLKAIGIYSQTQPIHPGRWRPIGENVLVVSNQMEPVKGKINPIYVQKIAVKSIFKLLR